MGNQLSDSAQPPSVVHVDMDCFYVSVERLLDPSLEGKPVAVGGAAEGRGVVSSASYEARKFGVRSAMPMAQAVRLCPALVVVRGTHSRYGEFTGHVRAIMEAFTPLVQMASQDEAYLDLTGTEKLWGPPLRAARAIHDRIEGETKLPCSLGVSTNKLVAKVASGMAKPRGLLYIPAGSEARFFAPLPVEYLPGVGPKSLERLREIGIRTMGDLTAMDARRLESHFGRHGADLARRAAGISESAVTTGEAAKSISAEETFDRDSADVEFLGGVLSNLCEKVAYRLRRAECRAATITLKLRFSDFETITASITPHAPVDDEADMLRIARDLLMSRWDRARPIRLLGIAGGNLRHEGNQLDLLDSATDERKERLHDAIDALREKHGYGSVRRASSGGRAEETNDRRWG